MNTSFVIFIYNPGHDMTTIMFYHPLQPLLPPHLRSNQPSDTQITSSSDSGHYDLVATSNSQEYTE